VAGGNPALARSWKSIAAIAMRILPAPLRVRGALYERVVTVL